MAYIKFNSSPQFISIPYWFITHYMPKALSGYLKVYLYLFASSQNPNTNASIEETCKALDMLHSEVIQALDYWHEQKVLRFEKTSDEQYLLEFYINEPQKVTAESVVSEKPKSLPIAKTIITQSRPEYRTDEINYCLERSNELTSLFKIAEQYLGRLLTITDQKIIFSFYDWLHMPFDLIEFLIEHCASSNHRAIHYIEKVAISWVDEGITTLEKAKEKVALDKRYFKILSALGSSKSNITLIEKTCIDKWLATYKFSMDVILEACKRTVMQTNKPSLNYTDTILTSWYKDKVKTLEDIAVLDKAHESKKMLAAPEPISNTRPNKVSKFTNIYSHNWDFDELERLESEYIDRKLNGGS